MVLETKIWVVGVLVTTVVSFMQPHGLYLALQAPLSLGLSRQEYWNNCTEKIAEEIILGKMFGDD